MAKLGASDGLSCSMCLQVNFVLLVHVPAEKTQEIKYGSVAPLESNIISGVAKSLDILRFISSCL